MSEGGRFNRVGFRPKTYCTATQVTDKGGSKGEEGFVGLKTYIRRQFDESDKKSIKCIIRSNK